MISNGSEWNPRGTNTFDGLWNSQLVPTVKGIADHGFNLIRVPISAELINQWAAGEYPKANYNNAYNEELNAMNSLEIFDSVLYPRFIPPPAFKRRRSSS